MKLVFDIIPSDSGIHMDATTWLQPELKIDGIPMKLVQNKLVCLFYHLDLNIIIHR